MSGTTAGYTQSLIRPDDFRVITGIGLPAGTDGAAARRHDIQAPIDMGGIAISSASTKPSPIGKMVMGIGRCAHFCARGA